MAAFPLRRWRSSWCTRKASPIKAVWCLQLSTRMRFSASFCNARETCVTASLKPAFFDDDWIPVTQKAVACLSQCFHRLIERGVPRDSARRFMLQTSAAQFCKDLGVTCKGGLLSSTERIELQESEAELLLEVAAIDWSNVRPEIFGTLLEHSLDQRQRRAHGAHFTDPRDIMKIVGPTIAEPWAELIENADSQQGLCDLHARLTRTRVLDPACGSGNFLCVAYMQMKHLESIILGKIDSPRQVATDRVSAGQFYGIDIDPLSVELAKLTVMIAGILCDKETSREENSLSFESLDANFIVGDALIVSESLELTASGKEHWRRPMKENGQPVITPWPDVDVIIGNPPFNGAKKLKPGFGDEYADALRAAYPQIPGMADYCVYWFRRAHDHLPTCDSQQPQQGRAGLVGTQNIRNNKSREGGLDYIAQSGTIISAVENQPWSGDANVHVSIANWVKHDPGAMNSPQKNGACSVEGLLIPSQVKLWSKVASRPHVKVRRGPNPGSTVYELACRKCDYISSALTDGVAVSQAVALVGNTQRQRCFQGVVPGYREFAVEEDQANRLLQLDPACRKLIKPWMTGRDLLTGQGTPSRLVIDFAKRSLDEAACFAAAFEHLKADVLPRVRSAAQDAPPSMKAARTEHLNRWWQFWNVRSEMRTALSGLSRFIACSRVSKRPIFMFVPVEIVPDGSLQVWALEDEYSFGVIQSSAHSEWFLANSSKLKSDYRYTRRSVWDTFPWPPSPSVEAIRRVSAAASAVNQERSIALQHAKGGLRGVYRLLERSGNHPLRSAHQELDAAVLEAYGFRKRYSLLEQLLNLNLQLAQREKAGVR